MATGQHGHTIPGGDIREANLHTMPRSHNKEYASIYLRIYRQKPCRADCDASAICNKLALQLCTNRVCLELGAVLENHIDHSIVAA